MRETRATILWVFLGLLGAALVAWGWPRAYSLVPLGWQVTPAEAKVIALERLRDLGEPVDDAYVVVRSLVDPQLERRLQLATAEADPAALGRSELGRGYFLWDILVYPPGAQVRDWVYRAFVGLDGEVLSLRRNPRPRAVGGAEGGSHLGDRPDAAGIDEGSEPGDAEAARLALEHLRRQGIEASRFLPEPRILDRQEGGRELQALQFTSREAILGEGFPYGVEVTLAADEVLGFGPWREDPAPRELQEVFQQLQLVGFGQWGLSYLLLIVLAVPFLRRYHDGQLGVRRGTQFFAAVLLGGLLWLLLVSRELSTGFDMGFPTREQTTWLVGLVLFFSRFFVLAVLAMMAWSLGESICRERWPEKLASLDALLRLKWRNATVARASLRGFAGGALTAGLLLLGAVLVQHLGAWPTATDGVLMAAPLPSLMLASGALAFYLPFSLVVCLLVPAWATRRFGPWRAMAISVAIGAVLVPFLVIPLPIEVGLLPWLVAVAVPIALFFLADLLAAVFALCSAAVVLGVAPLFYAQDPYFQVHGALALLGVSLPLWISLRQLGSDEEFVYHYDDVPPHVRRIAERERQRVELETARNIQSSILPELPPAVNGIEVAHTYLPATEVGGDFYDVLALEDGRLAVAVGDVAGHGVSSGLVMSMAKSALAVQVAFDPEVESVFRTLNRMVYQSARQRLLTTLCYALLDPRLGELYYASAGHLYPYRISPDGMVEALEAASYPLGVRGAIDVRVRTAKLRPGDTVFLYSDGLVEATPEGSDEPFGFDRLERSLSRHAGSSPQRMRDGVLLEVEAYTGIRPRDDDLTLLVLRLPAA